MWCHLNSVHVGRVPSDGAPGSRQACLHRAFDQPSLLPHDSPSRMHASPPPHTHTHSFTRSPTPSIIPRPTPSPHPLLPPSRPPALPYVSRPAPGATYPSMCGGPTLGDLVCNGSTSSFYGPICACSPLGKPLARARRRGGGGRGWSHVSYLHAGLSGCAGLPTHDREPAG